MPKTCYNNLDISDSDVDKMAKPVFFLQNYKIKRT